MQIYTELTIFFLIQIYFLFFYNFIHGTLINSPKYLPGFQYTYTSSSKPFNRSTTNTTTHTYCYNTYISHHYTSYILYFYVIIHIAYILIFSFWFQGVSTASKLYFFTSFHSYCNSASSPSLILPLFLLLLLFCSSQFSLIFTNIHILYNSIYTLFYFTFNLCCSYCRTASSEDCERSEAGRWSWHTKQEAGGAGRALGPSEQQRSVTCEGVVKGDERMRRSTNAGRGGWGGGSTRAAPRRSRMRKS